MLEWICSCIFMFACLQIICLVLRNEATPGLHNSIIYLRHNLLIQHVSVAAKQNISSCCCIDVITFDSDVDDTFLHWLKTCECEWINCRSPRVDEFWEDQRFQWLSFKNVLCGLHDYISHLQLSLCLSFDFLFSSVLCRSRQEEPQVHDTLMMYVVTKVSSGNCVKSFQSSLVWAFVFYLFVF